jgi:hypothetical protein
METVSARKMDVTGCVELRPMDLMDQRMAEAVASRSRKKCRFQ